MEALHRKKLDVNSMYYEYDDKPYYERSLLHHVVDESLTFMI